MTLQKKGSDQSVKKKSESKVHNNCKHDLVYWYSMYDGVCVACEEIQYD